MTDEKRALLGDCEAAKRLTDAGILLPCPVCGGQAKMIKPKAFKRFIFKTKTEMPTCTKCGAGTLVKTDAKTAMLIWNTRAPVLSKEEMEMLDECSL